MLSSTGSASAAPRPRSTNRRDRCIFVMITGALLLCCRRRGRRSGPHLELIALDDTLDERRPFVLVVAQRVDQLADDRGILIPEPAPERINQHLLGYRPHHLVALAEERLAEFLGARHLRAVELDVGVDAGAAVGLTVAADGIVVLEREAE